uniref:Uncharacterized protein n=1 Tax=Cucumis melo TaxID=3656 RepID=A0A9I9DAW7_CUCME
MADPLCKREKQGGIFVSDSSEYQILRLQIVAISIFIRKQGGRKLRLSCTESRAASTKNGKMTVHSAATDAGGSQQSPRIVGN